MSEATDMTEEVDASAAADTPAAIEMPVAPAPVAIHKTDILLSRRSFTLDDEGATLTLIARVNCPQFCDLTGTTILMQSSLGDEWEVELTSFNGVENETAEIVVTTASIPGIYCWTATYLDAAEGRPTHTETSSTVRFDYRPHTVSLAVWDITSPVAAGAFVEAKVGAKCGNECSLAGKEILLHDEHGVALATAILGEDVWEGTSALYWAALTLTAPDVEGVHTYTVAIDASEEHAAAQTNFSLAVTPAPDCELTLLIRDKETQEPLEGATIALHPQVSMTDKDGVACIPAKTGQGKLTAKLPGYHYQQLDVLITGDATLTIDLTAKPVYEDDF